MAGYSEIIIIMYIYHALIIALSNHMIHINLNMTFCAHVEHSLTKTIYIKYYTKTKQNKTCTTNTHTHMHAYMHAPPPPPPHTHTHTHTHTRNDCSRNWVLILVRVHMHLTYATLLELIQCMVYTECTEKAAVSHGTSHVSAVNTPLQWIYSKTRYKN